MRDTSPPFRSWPALLAPLSIFAACSSGTDGRDSSWIARTDTVGDTVVVHTVSGGQWDGPADLVEELRIGRLEGRDEEMLGAVVGLAVDTTGNIYVYDRQAPALRKYGPDGRFLLTFGRRGQGPGEYANSDGGLAVLPDGRVVLRDPGNARYSLWHADGRYDTSWPGLGGFFTSRPLFVDTVGHVYTEVFQNRAPGVAVTSGSLWRERLVRMALDGTPLDTLSLPDYGFEGPTIVAQRRSNGGTSTSMNTVPFAPSFQWTFSPLGYFVAGVSNRYAVDLHRTDGLMLRIAREAPPVSVSGEEKADAEANATANMRRTDPTWRWNGPPIPDVKPAFQSLLTGLDGRIWVQVPGPGEEIPLTAEEEGAARDPNQVPPRRFREPVIFDVFEPDGGYLGQVFAPEGFSLSPRPVFRGDRVWAVFRDALDVNYLVRYRLAPVGRGRAGGE